MIKNWTLKNFKSVSKETQLDFAPLTLFAGANSSGKSTILQSILLTAQTIQNSVQKKSVILNGNISKFGVFDDLISNNAEGDIIQLAFTLEPKIGDTDEEHYYYSRFEDIEDFENLYCRFSFTGKSTDGPNDFLQLQPRLESSYLKINYKDEQPQEIEVVRSKKTIGERMRELNLTDSIATRNTLSLEYEILKPTRLLQLPEYYYGPRPKIARFGGAFMDHFLPGSISIVFDKVDNDKRQFVDALLFLHTPEDETFYNYLNEEIKNLILSFVDQIAEEFKDAGGLELNYQRFINFSKRLKDEFTLLNFRRLARIPKLGTELLSKIEDSRDQIVPLMQFEKKTDYDIEFLNSYNSYNDYISRFFKRNVKYLGPLRDEPKPVYPLAGTSDPKDIGLKGENTASVLDLNSATIITYLPSAYFDKTNTVSEPVTATLLSAVSDWLVYMGVANEVKTYDKGKFGHEMKIQSPNSSTLHDLTHVGVGVSQLLPILVLALLSESDTTMIFEQPELHLHPRVQTRLADFFVSMSILNKQCIIETHSEYIINRLRYRIADSLDDNATENAIIYFVEKDEGSSNYRKMAINKYGVILDWPKGFFDEGENNSSDILKAGLEKRKREGK